MLKLVVCRLTTKFLLLKFLQLKIEKPILMYLIKNLFLNILIKKSNTFAIDRCKYATAESLLQPAPPAKKIIKGGNKLKVQFITQNK